MRKGAFSMADDTSKVKALDGISVFFGGEDDVFLDNMRKSLQAVQDINFIGTCRSIKGVLDILSMPEANPDIFYLSISIANEMASLDRNLIRDMKEQVENSGVIVLGESLYMEDVVLMLNEGVKGYILKNAPLSCIEKSIRAVYAGEIWLDRSIVSRALELYLGSDNSSAEGLNPELSAEYDNRFNKVSKREWEILELISRGYRNEDIAQTLFISIKTVKTHVKNIFRKLECRGRLEAALLFIEHSGDRLYSNSKRGFSKIIDNLKKIR
jgi:DNA-binding NarL/FixJ family response regulator